MPTLSPIAPIQGIPQLDRILPAGKTETANAFQAILDQSVRRVEGMQTDANSAVDQFLSGERDDPHTMMMAVQRADLAFDMFMQVRNKVVQAYQEIMRLPE